MFFKGFPASGERGVAEAALGGTLGRAEIPGRFLQGFLERFWEMLLATEFALHVTWFALLQDFSQVASGRLPRNCLQESFLRSGSRKVSQLASGWLPRKWLQEGLPGSGSRMEWAQKRS